MADKRVLGLFISDCHFDDQAPIARSVEKDWLEVQRKYVEQVKLLSIEHKCPVFIAGDVFNKWNVSAYLLSHVICWLRGMEVYGIPGNHDLPQHNYKQLCRSGYWTLVEAGVLKHLTPGHALGCGELLVSAFPHGFNVKPPDLTHSLCLNVALVHSYIWIRNKGHKDASTESHYKNWASQLIPYDAAFIGDNHEGFLVKGASGNYVQNCGTFIRRHINEKDYKPCVGLLWSDRSVTRHYLDTSHDRFIDMEKDVVEKLEKGLTIDLSEFVDELTKTHGQKVDLVQVALWLLRQGGATEDVKTLVLKALGGK